MVCTSVLISLQGWISGGLMNLLTAVMAVSTSLRFSTDSWNSVPSSAKVNHLFSGSIVTEVLMLTNF